MQYDDLLDRLESALERGDVRAAEIERLLRDRGSRRPDAAAVLSALGLAVALAGVALLYAMGYSDLSHGAQLVTPFAFPAVTLAVAIALAMAGRPLWQAETAGLLGQVALAVAFVVAEHELNPQNTAVYGAVCALAGVLEVLVCHRAIGSVRLTGWGLSASIVGLVSFSAVAIIPGGSGDPLISLAGLVLIEALVALGIAALLIQRDNEFGVHAARTAALLGYGAAVLGQGQGDWESFSIWILVISVAAVATFLAAAALRLDALVWVGALGGVIWMGLVTAVSGSDMGSAGIVLMAGLGLTGLGLLVAQLRRVTRAAG